MGINNLQHSIAFQYYKNLQNIYFILISMILHCIIDHFNLSFILFLKDLKKIINI